MSFSAGVYTLPTPALVPGQTVSSSENNTVRNDMAASFNLTWLRNGTAAATANIPMGSFKLTGLGAATTSGDALSYGNAAVVTTLTSTSLTATRVPYAGTGGLLQDASTFTFDGTTLTAGGFTTSGAISAGTITASGAITVSGGTANGVAYLNGSKVLTTGSALTFDGTNLGIGVTPSIGKLHLKQTTDSASGGITLQDSGANTSLRIWADATNGYVYGGSAGNLPVVLNATPAIFQIAGTEGMRLTSTGLGIGTSSPSQKLHVSSSSGTDIRCQTTDTTNAAATLSLVSANTYYLQSLPSASGSALRIFDGTAGAERLRLDSSGNLGLGVTPSAWSLGKAIELGSIGNTVWSSGSANMRLITNMVYNGGAKYAVNGYATQYMQDSGVHYWYTAPSGTAGNAITFTQAMTLDASGNLGIGTSSPNIGGFSKALTLNTTGSSVGLEFGLNGTQYGVIYGQSSSFVLNSPQSIPMVFAVNGSERMRIDSSGNLLVGVTSATSGGGVIQVSNGITFPATQSASSDANTLDDYEEGTFTPTLVCSTTNPTVGYGVQSGSYTKIGNMVSVYVRLQLSSISGGSGNVRIGGLPFSSSSARAAAGVAYFSNTTLISGYTQFGIYVNASATTADLAQSGSGVGANIIGPSVIGNAFDVVFTMTYTV